ncbi:MAG: J domain-containing protein [Hyphomonadaceae bacterium]
MVTAAIFILVAVFAALLILRFAGSHRRSATRFAPAIIVGMAAILFAVRGNALAALILGVGAAALWMWSSAGSQRAPREEPKPPPARANAMSDAQARAILGVQPGASEAEIRAAFRRRIAIAHPDQGGSTEEAARLSAARDALLRR